MPNRDFFTSRGAYVNLRYIAILYTYSIGNQLYNTMAVFKMRDSVPNARYSSVCNVLHQWRIWLIPTYRGYRLYDTPYEGFARILLYRHNIRKINYVKIKSIPFVIDLSNIIIYHYIY